MDSELSLSLSVKTSNKLSTLPVGAKDPGSVAVDGVMTEEVLAEPGTETGDKPIIGAVGAGPRGGGSETLL